VVENDRRMSVIERLSIAGRGEVCRQWLTLYSE
jgi:hypothetical protein